jgi:hypothetical protein
MIHQVVAVDRAACCGRDFAGTGIPGHDLAVELELVDCRVFAIFEVDLQAAG